MPDKVVVRLISRKPAEKGDIPEPEQSYVYHWHRILAALLVLAALVAGMIAGIQRLFPAREPVAQAVIETPATPPVQAPPVTQPISRSQPAEQVPEAAQSPSAASETSAAAPANQPEQGKPVQPGTAKVSIRSASIKRAQLTSNVVNGQPVDQIGPIIPMNEQGLVKVFLWTEIDDIKGRKMFHDWYRNGKRVFHARIPVTRSHQSGTSIKFIDRSMTGDWEVKVVDNYNRLYAEARFEVR